MKALIAAVFFILGYSLAIEHPVQRKPAEIVVDTPTKRCIISTYKPHSFESAVKRTE